MLFDNIQDQRVVLFGSGETEYYGLVLDACQMPTVKDWELYPSKGVKQAEEAWGEQSTLTPNTIRFKTALAGRASASRRVH